MKKIKTIVIWTVWTLVAFYLSVAVLLEVPAVQRHIGSAVSKALAQQLGTDVEVGKVHLGLFNRITIDDVHLKDQQGQPMLDVSRLSTKIDLLPLLDGKVHISSAQLFGMNARISRADASSPLNIQFVLDSLKPKDDTPAKPLDLQIRSLVIRNGAFSYDQFDQPTTEGLLNPSHLRVTGLSSHLMLYALTDDSLSLNVKRLTMKESSGLDIRSLRFRVEANRQQATIDECKLQLPNTALSLSDLQARYRSTDGTPDWATISYQGTLNPSKITPSDIACIVPTLKNFTNSISLNTVFSGTSHSAELKGLEVKSDKGTLNLLADVSVRDWNYAPLWHTDIHRLDLSADGIQFVAKNLQGKTLSIPDEVIRMGNIHFTGSLHGKGKAVGGKGMLETDAGSAQLAAELNGQEFAGSIETPRLDLKRILADDRFGNVSADLQAKGRLGADVQLALKGHAPHFDYNGYPFQNLQVDGVYSHQTFDGLFSMNDPNGQVEIDGLIAVPESKYVAHASVRHFNPSVMKLVEMDGNRSFDFDVDADFTGESLATANGTLQLRDFTMRQNGENFRINQLNIKTGYVENRHFIDMDSDFGDLSLNGKYDYATLAQSVVNLIGDKLPTLPGLPRVTSGTHNDFTVDAHLQDAEFLRVFLGVPITLRVPAHLSGTMNDSRQQMELHLDMPSVIYDGSRYEELRLNMSTRDDALQAQLRANKVSDTGQRLSLAVNALACDNNLTTHLRFDNHSPQPLKGEVAADTYFFKDDAGKDAAHITFHLSDIQVGDSIWEVQPSDVIYASNGVNIDHFEVSHNQQHIIVNGMATSHASDSVLVDLQDVDVSYILNLVNFHSVKFSGLASGQAYVKRVLSKPVASARLAVKDFRFQDGQMGTLHARADYDTDEGQVNIDAVADDGDAQTLIRGYVSPKRNYIDLGILADGTRLQFLESFCGSFMDHVDAHARGRCRVFGDLKTINLEGQLVADGTLDLKTLNTSYALRNDTITLVPDEIIFHNDTVYDRYGHFGIVNGALHHQHLTRLTYDIGVEARNLLAYDFHDFGSNTFYGTVFGTGSCMIRGRSGEITMDIDVTPEKGSFIEYNAASPDAITETSFIRWNDVTPDSTAAANPFLLRQASGARISTIRYPLSVSEAQSPVDIPSDLRLNFNINATPDVTLRVLMDTQTGDKIALHGTGALRATYFNKGAFQMFGNYLVDDGTYTMTIQNVIKKEFHFQPGSSIIFGGDPYDAALNLKAQYAINGVSLSDLQVGRSFTNNNIRVNCLMNISGTPAAPTVTFDLDLPTLSTDAQQMVRSLINSEEDMNQQVLYLLAVGRFYPPSNNNMGSENPEAQSQTSLAMQSILSGTISQQINNVLSNVIHNTHWNFGANISTGNEGWTNAEYEGVLSGRLLNNRLLINGEFGYRDNAETSQTSFIGDFDIRYLIIPNGNLAIKVYNETNDRYFTRNSLNTQGIGLIMKKDFTSLNDLWGRKKKKKKQGEP